MPATPDSSLAPRWEEFRRFYQEVFGQAVNLAKSQLGCHGDLACDAVHDVTLRILQRYWHTWAGLPAAQRKAYFMKAVLNACRSRLRMPEEALSPELFEEALDSPCGSPFEDEVVEHLSDPTPSLLESLLPDRAEAVRLYLQGYSREEAAHRLGVNYSTYTTRLNRGLDDLARLFGVDKRPRRRLSR